MSRLPPFFSIIIPIRGRPRLRRAEPPRPSLAHIAPVLLQELTADGVDQLTGYVAGIGASAKYLTGFEFRRVDFVPASGRRFWQETA